jgi:hypothetical protein
MIPSIRLLSVIFVLVIGIGFIRGWFSVSKVSPEKGDNKVNVKFSVDREKMKSDIQRAEGRVVQRIEQIEENLTDKDKDKDKEEDGRGLPFRSDDRP